MSKCVQGNMCSVEYRSENGYKTDKLERLCLAFTSEKRGIQTASFQSYLDLLSCCSKGHLEARCLDLASGKSADTYEG